MAQNKNSNTARDYKRMMITGMKGAAKKLGNAPKKMTTTHKGKSEKGEKGMC